MSPFEALADPIRRDILGMLRDGELAAGMVVDRTGLAQPAISKHLKALREAGLIRVRSDGPRRLYSLDHARFAEFEAWLAPFRQYWAGKLDALGDHLNRSD